MISCLVSRLEAPVRSPQRKRSFEVIAHIPNITTDIIELGIPFTDPIADGPTIQKANTVALKNGINVSNLLQYVRDARKAGLTVPVLFMGYYNPILQYGEERLLTDCKEAGVNGFIIVDLPPEEAVAFRNFCAKGGLSYVPLIAPSTSDKRMKLLCSLADSFIYVVSRMGVTGATGELASGIPELIKKVKTFSGDKPAAVGFGVSTREHFLAVAGIADGVVIGSQIITEIANAPRGEEAKCVEEYCAKVGGRRALPKIATHEVSLTETVNENLEQQPNTVHVDAVITSAPGIGLADQIDALNSANADPKNIPSRFGEFGGAYVPESLMDCLEELDAGFNAIKDDEKFWEEYRTHYEWMGRPGHLHLAERLTEHAGGANIYLKREDLNHTGSHKINNALGQILLARRLGKTKIIAEIGRAHV